MSQLLTYDVDELGDFLTEKGIPGEAVLSFSENKIDGESFLDLTETDIKELVKPLGVVKKLLRILREVNTPPAQLSQVPSSPDAVLTTPVSSPSIQSPSLFSSSPNPSQASTVSVCCSDSSRSTSGFPLNFSVPNKWRPSIMFAIEQNKLTPDVRNEVVRDLVTHMYGYMEKPTASFCKFVAQRLILQYKFMRDSKGTGYGSWEKKLVERVSNVHRKRKLELSDQDDSDVNPRKRGRPRKTDACLDDRYPALSQTENCTAEEEKSASEALCQEMSNAKPRRDIFLPLMKSTFSLRRHFILHDALSVQDILREYPALKQTIAIEQEMELILSRPGIFNTFATEWRRKWVPSINMYCKALKRKDIVNCISNQRAANSGDTEGEEKLAVGLLVCLFMAKKQKYTDIMTTLYEECLIGEDPNIVAKEPPVRNSPRFAEFAAEGGDRSYFLFVEQKILCMTSSFTKAFFLWFSLHYIFHLSYFNPLSDLCTFIQEFIFGLPSKGKRSTSYLTTATDIQQFTVR